MRISILITILTSLIYFDASAQSMSWVSSRYSQSSSCQDLSDCTTNLMCYKLKYVPKTDGVLTSYTTSFVVNCNDNLSAVRSNMSCSMNDNSSEINACDDKGLLLLNSSANNGNLRLNAGEPVFLHQICIQMNKKTDEVVFETPDPNLLSTSITEDSGEFRTEFIDYQKFTFMNSISHCLAEEPYLTLSAALEGETAEISWEPAKETREGIYTLYQKVNEDEFVAIETFEPKMLDQVNAFKYTYDLPLEEYGDHLFRVTYEDHKSELKSNISEIYFRDLRFSMTVSPNPTADFIKLFVNSTDSEVELRITNMEGKIVIKKMIKTDENTIQELSDLKAGMYNVSVYSKNSQLTEKVILIN